MIRFHNSHLVYALMWFALAGMTVLWSAWPWLEARLEAFARGAERASALPAKVGRGLAMRKRASTNV